MRHMTIPLTRFRGPVAFWALAGVAWLVSHDAIYLAQIGPGQVLAATLRQAGHDHWGLASLALAVGGLVGIAWTAIHLRELQRRALALEAARPQRARSFTTRWLLTWGRLLPMVAIGFALQENVEHVITHGHAPGLGALIGPEFPLALPVIATISALASLAAAALSQTEQALLAAIADALRRFVGRAPRQVQRPPQRSPVRHLSPLASASAGRAPPRAFVSAT